MDKSEIIKLLDKEVGLAVVFEDENEAGDLYISSAQLKSAEKVLRDLARHRDSAKKWEQDLKSIVDGQDRFTVIRDIDRVSNTTFESPHPIIIIGEKMVIINNIFNELKIK